MAPFGTDHGRGFAFIAMGAGVAEKFTGITRVCQDDQYQLGPGGLQITCDYRSVLAEVLSYHGAPVEQIFPDFKPEPVGIMKTT